MVNIGDPASNLANRPSSISGIDNDPSGNLGSNNYDNSPGSSSLNGPDSQRKNDDVGFSSFSYMNVPECIITPEWPLLFLSFDFSETGSLHYAGGFTFPST